MGATAVGIDLGTTNSCVAVVKTNSVSAKTVDILVNRFGHRVTPSMVAFTEDERIVGNAAKNQLTRNHENTVYNVKRLIGRKMDEEEVRGVIDKFPFRVTSDNEVSWLTSSQV